jgi:hypothetical protein
MRRVTAPVPTVVAAFCCALLSVAFSPANAEVRAFLDRQQVYEDDQVRLTIEADGASANGQPELAPLRDDFMVGGTGTSRQTRIINGRRSDRTSWQVALEPKGVGTLTIPGIRVGDERTEPLTLKVEPVPAEGIGAPGDEVWLEVAVEADRDDLMVQQQVPLVVRAFSARPLLDYAIEVPEVDGALLTRIGRDRGEITSRAGRQYRVIERRFMLNPQRSGELRIPPITFDAELKTTSSARSGVRPPIPDLFDDPMIERMLGGIGGSPGFSMFERGEPARARSGPLTFEVASAPASFGGTHWLPASDLEIEDSWNPADGGEPPRLTVGEPATRTLTLVATGLAGNQIPEIEIPAPDGFRVYPEKTEASTRSDGETLIGVSRQQVTLIPTSAGDRVLPKIAVRWWDIDDDSERSAVVPALPVQVVGAAGPAAGQNRGSATDAGPAGAPADGAGADTGAGANSPPSAAPPSVDAEDAAPTEDGNGWLRIGVAIILAAALLLALAFWWRRSRDARGADLRLQTADGSGSLDHRESRSRAGWFGLRLPSLGSTRSRPPSLPGRKPVVPKAGGGEPERGAIEALRTACEHDEARGAASALLRWGSLRWPSDPPISLRTLATRVDASQRAEIEALERALYGAADAASEWRGDGLWQAVERGLAPPADGQRAGTGSSDGNQGADALAPLYPHRT